MFLTLEVVGANGQGLGEGRCKTIGVEGMQIGRSPDNGWVINDPYISRVHARISHQNGAFYVEGLGRNPLAINHVSNFVSNHHPQLLKFADRFFLDQYEIVVTSVPEPVPQRVNAVPGLQSLQIPDALAVNGGSLDPLVALKVGSAASASKPMSANSDIGNGLDIHFAAPRAVATAPRIPETWNRTGLVAVDRQFSNEGSAVKQVSSQQQSSTSVVTAKSDAEQEIEKLDPTRSAMKPASGNVQPRAANTRSPPQPVAEPSRALSIDRSRFQPEVADDFGSVFRVVTQGVMEVLRARAQIKSEMRMSMTHIQPLENNPLKFSPNVEAALKAMLVERDDAWLPMTRAFEEAFADIRRHQIALLHGMRSAFEAMLEQFDPEHLQEELERIDKHSGRLLKVGSKARFKEFYAERFTQLSRDRDDGFKGLFEQHFTRAYEEQMTQFKVSEAAGTHTADI